MVWAIPRSLATTCGITIVFSSSGYLDVSVPRVTVFRHHAFSVIGFPIRTSTDQCLFAAPRSFSQLITSFVVSESLGIPHTLLFASYSSTFDLLSHIRSSLCALMSWLLLLVNYTTSPVLSMNFSKTFLFVFPSSNLCLFGSRSPKLNKRFYRR